MYLFVCTKYCIGNSTCKRRYRGSAASLLALVADFLRCSSAIWRPLIDPIVICALAPCAWKRRSRAAIIFSAFLRAIRSPASARRTQCSDTSAWRDNSAWLHENRSKCPSGQCHLNKKNISEALLFENKTLLPGSFTMKAGIGTFDDTRKKAEAAGREEGSGFSQICQELLLKPGEFLAGDQSECIAGGVKHLDGMREAESVRVQIGLASGLVHPPTHEVMRQEQPVEFLAHQSRLFTAHRLVAQAEMVFLLIDAGFNFPALMIAEDEFCGGRLLRVKQSCHQAMELAWISAVGCLRRRELRQALCRCRLDVIRDYPHLHIGSPAGCKVTR